MLSDVNMISRMAGCHVLSRLATPERLVPHCASAAVPVEELKLAAGGNSELRAQLSQAEAAQRHQQAELDRSALSRTYSRACNSCTPCGIAVHNKSSGLYWRSWRSHLADYETRGKQGHIARLALLCDLGNAAVLLLTCRMTVDIRSSTHVRQVRSKTAAFPAHATPRQWCGVRDHFSSRGSVIIPTV